MAEWIDPYSLPEDSEQRRLHLGRYKWAAGMIHGSKVANAACSNNYGAEILDDGLREIVGFDRNPVSLAQAKDRYKKYAVVEGDIQNQTFDGFTTLVCLETFEHLKEPWKFLDGLSKTVKELVLSTPIIPTKHFNEFHLHDFTQKDVVDGLKDRGWKIQSVAYQDESFLAKPTYILVYATR